MNASPLESARRYLAMGYSILPIATDGRKRPAGQVLPRDQDGKPSWLPFQTRVATETDLTNWYGSTVPYGIGIICGEISSRLIVLDCEAEGVWLDIEREAVGQGLGDLIRESALMATPSGGRHLYVHLTEGFPVPAGTVLARDQNRDVLVETRGAGHYVVAPGSPSSVHESGQEYRVERFPESLVQWSESQLAALLEIAKSFNAYVAPEALVNKAQKSGGQTDHEPDSPGSTLNRIGDWAEILEPFGWRAVGVRGECVLWCRPGKTSGISATTGHCRTAGSGDLLYVFSSSASPFEPDHSYSKFAAYSLLNHSGDFSAAASDLRNRGVGGTPSSDFQFSVTLPPADQIQPDGSVRARRYKFSSELSLIDPDLQWIVHGLIRRGAGTMLSAHPKVGKTTWLAHMLQALGIGETFCGMATKPTKVMVVSEEDESTLAERCREIGIGDHVAWFVRPFPSRPTMAQWIAFLKEIRHDVSDIGAGLVVVDTLAKHLPLRDENHATEVESALQPLWQLTAQDVGLLCVHHSRKVLAEDGTSARGSMAFNGHFEILLELIRADNTPGNCQRILKGMSRLKHVPEELVMELVDGRYRAMGNQAEVERHRIESMVMEYVANNSLTNAGQVSRHAGITIQRASEMLEALVAGGHLSAIGEGTRRSPRQYQVL